MSEQEKLTSADQKVAYLMDNIPAARSNYVYLILTYWEIFDGIDIPEKLLQEITEKATQPETISRSRRKVLERNRIKQYLEMQRIAKVQD